MKIKAMFTPLSLVLTITFFSGIFSTQTYALGTYIEPLVENEPFFFSDIGALMTRIVEVALVLGSVAALLFLIWGAIEWLTSGGDKSRLEAARARISNAVVGLAIAAAAWALWVLALNIFNLSNNSLFSIGGGTTPWVDTCKDLPSTARDTCYNNADKCTKIIDAAMRRDCLIRVGQ